MFDPVSWASGFVLTKRSAHLLKALQPDELQARMEREAAEWAAALPADVGVNPRRIFGDESSQQLFAETSAPLDPEARPARFRLQEVLQDFLRSWKVLDMARQCGALRTPCDCGLLDCHRDPSSYASVGAQLEGHASARLAQFLWGLGE
jgi:hypothetical protein